MRDCAESQTRVCKAYITDCYGHLANSYNKCKSGDRQILKKNIFDMLDRIKMLLNNNISESEESPVEEIETDLSDNINWFGNNTEN